MCFTIDSSRNLYALQTKLRLGLTIGNDDSPAENGKSEPEEDNKALPVEAQRKLEAKLQMVNEENQMLYESLSHRTAENDRLRSQIALMENQPESHLEDDLLPEQQRRQRQLAIAESSHSMTGGSAGHGSLLLASHAAEVAVPSESRKGKEKIEYSLENDDNQNKKLKLSPNNSDENPREAAKMRKARVCVRLKSEAEKVTSSQQVDE